MLQTRLLKNIFLSACVLAISILGYIYAVIHPDYHDLLIENAEDEAARFASFLVASNSINRPLTHDTIPNDIASEVGRLSGDEQLIKLRIFSPAGEIIFSTLPKEIGRRNEYDYFHNQVAKGNVYSKTVQKNAMTAEMEIVATDLVETYIPIMDDGRFLGAIETYYDITSSSRKISELTRHSLNLLSGVALVILALLYYILRHADRSIQARELAENNLRIANEELESRVAKRAGELVEANEKLTREIAERTLAQMALSEALSEMQEDKEKISGILRSVDDGLLVIDSEDRVVLMNEPAEQILGISHEQAASLRVSGLLADDKLQGPLTTLLAPDAPAHLDFALQRENAPPSIYHARSSRLRDKDGQAKGIVILMQDVTHERQLDQMKADFLAMAAHELSTPLATIIGYADLLGGDSDVELTPAIQNESLTYIHDKANALSRIVDDLLDVSRVESGQKLTIRPIPYNLCKALEAMVKTYSDIHSEHRIELSHCDPDGDLKADPIRISQVMENILSNAIKYTPAGGQITVSSSRDGDFHRVEVRDDGIGMTAEQLEHVFDKFYRADGSDTAKPGIGLGMSITKHIIEGHGGSISVESQPDRGTRVTFLLPRSSPATD